MNVEKFSFKKKTKKRKEKKGREVDNERYIDNTGVTQATVSEPHISYISYITYIISYHIQSTKYEIQIKIAERSLTSIKKGIRIKNERETQKKNRMKKWGI